MEEKENEMVAENGVDEVDSIDVQHLETISDYKNYAKGSMDIAYLLSTANQLRHTISIDEPYRGVVIGLLSFSLVLQVTSSILLLVEHMTDPKNYSTRKKLNISIGVIMIIIIVIHILTTAFGGPDNN